VLNIIVPVFDLGMSFGKFKSRKSLEKVLKKSGNLYSKLRRNPDSTLCEMFANLKPCPAVEVVSKLTEVRAVEKRTIELTAEVTNDKLKGVWMKDGVPLEANNRIQVMTASISVKRSSIVFTTVQLAADNK